MTWPAQEDENIYSSNPVIRVILRRMCKSLCSSGAFLLQSLFYLALILCGALNAQTISVGAPNTAFPIDRRGIDTYAIINARIITLAGERAGSATIERGTIIIRDGLIESVGAQITPPRDARTIDGTGLSVYPGLIDANTTLGMQPAASSAGPTSARGAAITTNVINQPATFIQPNTNLNSTQPPGLQPEITAADILRPNEATIEAARNAGITAALTSPREGIFAGQSAFINLSGDTPQEMVLRSPVALHISFTPLRTGAYPTSLMGVFSAIRQSFLDAQRYTEANAVYARSPRGLRRPLPDRSLAALVPVVTGQMPVVMYAESEREIMRALDLAREFNLRAIIAGGGESWKVADRLRAMNVPVLLSLNFPKRTTTQIPEADPEPLRILRERADAPKTAARLAAAKVRFAFQSNALTNPADFLVNAAKTVENGLARDEALRAMTVNAAEVFGVADRLGTIERGKIANLTVMRGDIFDRNARLSYVFIDGRPIDLKPATQTPPPSPGQPAVAAGTFSGIWTLKVNTEEGEKIITLMLRQEGERLSGALAGALGSAQIANASVSAGGEIRFTAPINSGGVTTEATFTGNIAGNDMRGSVQIVGRTAQTFTGTRPTPQ